MQATFNEAHILQLVPCRVEPYLVYIIFLGILCLLDLYHGTHRESRTFVDQQHLSSTLKCAHQVSKQDILAEECKFFLELDY